MGCGGRQRLHIGGGGPPLPEADGLCGGKKPEEQANIKANIRAYGCHTIKLVPGEAPALLAGLPDPDRVFIGGSGGNLAEIIATAARRLRPGGSMVANAVLPQTASAAPDLMRGHGLSVDARTIRVTKIEEKHNEELSPITIIRGRK